MYPLVDNAEVYCPYLCPFCNREHQFNKMYSLENHQRTEDCKNFSEHHRLMQFHVKYKISYHCLSEDNNHKCSLSVVLVKSK